MSHTMAKIAITIDAELLHRLDALVQKKYFKNRSQAIQQVVQKQVEKLEHHRLAQQCDKLEITSEQQMADEGLAEDMSTWQDY